ncbi:hypothetical protein B0H16DRAFT_220402 [Mycena metata]|uniref:Uncharacterized protein n=1 Tax=Mycena metata TaxID=1033252 RepID=A0AAD7HXA1_9AGAR|nr:hypothetical protein B0H16DRAFT_220402 [Mycena metata]
MEMVLHGTNLVRVLISFALPSSLVPSLHLLPLPAYVRRDTARRRTAISGADDLEFSKNFNIVVAVSLPRRALLPQSSTVGRHSTRPPCARLCMQAARLSLFPFPTTTLPLSVLQNLTARSPYCYCSVRQRVSTCISCGCHLATIPRLPRENA